MHRLGGVYYTPNDFSFPDPNTSYTRMLCAFYCMLNLKYVGTLLVGYIVRNELFHLIFPVKLSD